MTRAVEKAMEWLTRAAGVEDHHYRVSDAIDDYVDHLKVNNSEAASQDARKRLDNHLNDMIKATELSNLKTAQ